MVEWKAIQQWMNYLPVENKTYGFWDHNFFGTQYHS